ncbi:MAG TPA: GWxTD domain-containing protein [Candidatus Syntrophosphaera sp.]|nr:GWxTD domain-containing protein [Candidatus Syntrophosphaera sp.]
MVKAAELALLLLLLATLLPAQEIIFEHYGTGVDLWVLIPYNALVFKSGVTESNFQLVMELKNTKTKKTLGFDRAFVVPKRYWLQDTAIPVTFSAEIGPGNYQADLRLRNLTQGDKVDLRRNFTVGENYTEIGQPYFLLRKEGVTFQPAILHPLPVPLESCVLTQKFSLAADSVHIAGIADPRVFTYPQGSYTADLTAPANADSLAGLRLSLYEGNIRYDMAPFLYSQWFYYNARYSYKDQIQQLRYIATQNEWKSLRAVPAENMPEVIDRFWQVHDPSPGTLRNEAREAFYQRVMTADERFTIHKKLQGWKSDRGRIYIKYGEPDETHSEVHPLDLYPYIIWTYYSQKLEFIFADTGGFGQYRLRNKDEEY